MEEKLNAILDALDGLQQGQHEINDRLGRLEERQGHLEENQHRLAENQHRLEENQNRLEEKLDNFATETRRRFNYVESQLDEHKKIFTVVSDQLKTTQLEIDYLSEKTGLHDNKINTLEKRMQS